MGIFGNLFGKKNGNETAAPPSEVELIRRQIEATEGELHEAQDRLNLATDASIKESMTFLVARKTQAIADLEEKLRVAQARAK